MNISPADFQFMQQLLRARSGIVLETGKEYLVETRLLPILRSEKMESIGDLIGRIRQTRDERLTRAVVDAMTTNETSFFRDLHPFATLRSDILPDLAKKRAAERRLDIWCGAASTGQEPYTIAMVIKELGPLFHGWNINILATDLSSEVLDKAREGLYSQLEVNRGLPAPLLVKYFKQEGLSWRISAEIRAMVKYQELNLLSSFSQFPRMDLVFLRNVLIYFDLPTKRDILERIGRLLKPDAYLFLGGAETTVNVDDSYGRLTFGKTVCYQKLGTPAAVGSR